MVVSVVWIRMDSIGLVSLIRHPEAVLCGSGGFSGLNSLVLIRTVDLVDTM